MSFRILVADDDDEIRGLVQRYLKRELYEVETAADGEEVLSKINDNGPCGFDLIILDVMMPNLDGFGALSKLREQDDDTPVLFLTAKREDGDIIQGLGLGGDEYMTKPFSPAVLVARVKALMRIHARAAEKREQGRTDETDKQGVFTLDRRKCRVLKNAVPLELTATEYTIVKFFFENPDQVFTKNQLHERCWETPYYDENTVAVYIRRLREKLEDDPNKPRYLITMRGLGYYFSPEGKTQ
ncbi:MAG: response regulator transcription factor [Spirochaetia bacterium]